ncbi:MAG: universal stress protein [Chthoniobacterales bacterium]
MPPSVHGVDFRLAKEPARRENAGVEKILVPVDFSDASGRLIAVAEETARARGASLHLLHIMEPVATTAGLETDPAMAQLQVAQDLDAEERIESERLSKLAAEISARGLACSSAVKFGLPADEIISSAKDLGAGLVVMGSHGHGALYHLFTGSVVTSVLRRIDCPVLVVPLRQKKA